MAVDGAQRGIAAVNLCIEISGRQRKVELRAADGDPSLSGPLACSVDGRPLTVDAQLMRPGMLSLLIEGRQYRCILDGGAVIVDGRRCEFEVADPRSLQTRRGAGAGNEGVRSIKAPMPGRVVRVLVAVGEQVEAQQGLLVIEAMKMQNELKSPKAGKVTRLVVSVGDAVQAGSVLAVVE